MHYHLRLYTNRSLFNAVAETKRHCVPPGNVHVSKQVPRVPLLVIVQRIRITL